MCGCTSVTPPSALKEELTFLELQRVRSTRLETSKVDFDDVTFDSLTDSQTEGLGPYVRGEDYDRGTPMPRGTDRVRKGHKKLVFEARVRALLRADTKQSSVRSARAVASETSAFDHVTTQYARWPRSASRSYLCLISLVSKPRLHPPSLPYERPFFPLSRIAPLVAPQNSRAGRRHADRPSIARATSKRYAVRSRPARACMEHARRQTEPPCRHSSLWSCASCRYRFTTSRASRTSRYDLRLTPAHVHHPRLRVPSGSGTRLCSRTSFPNSQLGCPSLALCSRNGQTFGTLDSEANLITEPCRSKPV